MGISQLLIPVKLVCSMRSLHRDLISENFHDIASKLGEFYF
jgi:hypothetical protein